MAGKKTGKRLLTWVLVLVMALSLLPLNALAAEADEASALQMSDEDNSGDRSLMPTKDKTYTITFDANGGSFADGTDKFVGNYSSKDATVWSQSPKDNNPTNPPYVFKGWYKELGLIKTDVDIKNEKVRNVLLLPTDTSRILYAKWALPDGFEEASIFYLKDPTKNRDSNTGADWNGPLGGKEAGFVDTTSLVFTKSDTPGSGLKKVENSWDVQPNDVTWPTGFGTPSTDGLKLNKNTDEWNDIFEAFKTKVEADNGGIILTKDEVDSITLVPYKVSRYNSTGGSYHVDCDVVIKCNFVTVDFMVKNDSDNFASILNGKITCPKGQAFPKDKVPPAPEKVGYEFDDWYTDEACTEKADFTKPLTTDTTFYGKYVEKVTPQIPDFGKEQLAGMQVNVQCKTVTSHVKSYHFSELDGCYSSIMKDIEGSYHATVTLNRSSVVAKFNADEAAGGKTHNDTEPNAITSWTWTWDANDKAWRMDNTAPITDAWATIVVKCEGETQKPTAPSEEDLSKLEKPVKVVCTTKPTAHTEATFALIEKTYTIGDVTGNETDGYTCNITVTANEYVTKYNTYSDAHTLSGGNTKTLTLKYEEGKWVADGTVTFNVECTEAEKFPVELVIYRNGDTVNPYKRVRVAEVAKGTEIKAADYPIKNYYDGTNSGGKYDFYGWYNDGKWNDYNGNPANPPAGLEKITVNGWTNLKCMVYDYEKVVYFRSAEDLAAYQKDHSKTDGLLYTTTARFGSTLPTADAPTPKRTGYTFTFWSREGQSSDVTGQTVNGWTNLYANWEKDESQTQKTSYTVQHKVDGKIIDEDTKTYTNTAWINETNPTIAIVPGSLSPKSYDGYKYVGMEPEIITDTVASGTTITLTYEKRTDLSYTVHYYLKNTTKQVANDKMVAGQTFNADVTENAIRISGYRVYGDSVKSITIGTGTNEIIFYYTRAYHPSTPSKPTLNTGDHYAYVMGYPDGTVRPNGSITRAEVSAILFRLLSDKTRDEYFTTESSFTDVKAGAWYNNSIATLEKAGVIVDTAKGGAFRPNEAITRAELAAMLAQFSDAKPVKGVKFSDVSAEHWAYEAIAIAAKMGWIEGYPDGTFRPDATITRAEMMTLVNRALERVPSDEDHLLSKRVMLTFPDCKSGDWFYIAVQEATNSHTYERAATEKNGDEQWTALRANRDWTQLEK